MFSMWVVHFILVILLVANQAKKAWTLLVWSDVSEILFFCAGASESMNPSEEQDEVKEQKKKPDDVRLFKNKSYSKISLNDSDGFFLYSVKVLSDSEITAQQMWLHCPLVATKKTVMCDYGNNFNSGDDS